jgi:hypothetical protein
MSDDFVMSHELGHCCARIIDEVLPFLLSVNVIQTLRGHIGMGKLGEDVAEHVTCVVGEDFSEFAALAHREVNALSDDDNVEEIAHDMCSEKELTGELVKMCCGSLFNLSEHDFEKVDGPLREIVIEFVFAMKKAM